MTTLMPRQAPERDRDTGEIHKERDGPERFVPAARLNDRHLPALPADDHPITVMALGLRSISGVAGGIETHSEHLYRHLLDAGARIDIVVRAPYADPSNGRNWHGARITRIWSVRTPGLETALHTFLGVIYAGFSRPDVLHLHGVGPALFTPLARLLGLPVVVTHHGADYARAKWGATAKWILKTGERIAMRFANEVVSVSRYNAEQMRMEYGRLPIAIPNGVPTFEATPSRAVLEELGIDPGRYVLHVGRATPEKRQDDLIEAFVRASLPGWKLVLVGDMLGNDDFSARVRSMASAQSAVVLAGFRKGQALQTLFANAGCFALPSTIEGMSIALLEALRFACPVVASDIPANHEVELPAACYFAAGDIDAIATAISTIPRAIPREVWTRLAEHVRVEYDWSRIAERTLRVYRRAIAGGTRS